MWGALLCSSTPEQHALRVRGSSELATQIDSASIDEDVGIV